MNKSTTGLIVFISFVDLIGVGCIISLLPQYLIYEGYRASIVGLFSSIFGFSQLIFAPAVNQFANAYGCSKIFGFFVSLTAFGYLLSCFSYKYILLNAAVRAFLGSVKYTQDICRCCLLEFNKSKNKTALISFINSLSSFGLMIGSFFAAHFVAKFGIEEAMYYSYITSTCCCIFNSLLIFICLKPVLRKTENSFSSSNTILTMDKQKLLMRHQSKKTEQAVVSTAHWQTKSGLTTSCFLLAFSVIVFRFNFYYLLMKMYPFLNVAQICFVVTYNAIISFSIGLVLGPVSYLYKEKVEKFQMHAAFLLPIAFAVISLAPDLSWFMTGMTLLSTATNIFRACTVVLTAKHNTTTEGNTSPQLVNSSVAFARGLAPLVCGILLDFNPNFPIIISIFFSTIGSLFLYNSVYSIHVKKPYVY